MRELINIVLNDGWLETFCRDMSPAELVSRCGCDGVEAIRCAPYCDGAIPSGLIEGYHLMFYPDWVGFFQEDDAYITRHFGHREAAERYYGCKTPDDYVRLIRDDMDRAERLCARYAVFHVSDVSSGEILSYRYEHTNGEVIRASAELINAAMFGRDYHFTLLLENLFTPGMTLADPRETELMLSLTDYKNTGIMLDTGHLMCTDTRLGSEDEAIKYVIDTVRRHGALGDRFRGVHLHRSVTGSVVRELLSLRLTPDDDFYKAFAQSYAWVQRIDSHKPVESAAARDLIEFVEPEYIVHELAAANACEKLAAVAKQRAALGFV